MGTKLIDIEAYPVNAVLDRLLQDKTTRKNIIFATDSYADIGDGLTGKDHITAEKLTGFSGRIKIVPRVEKALEEQQARTKQKAEVMTPLFIINKMNSHCDTEWFGRENVFNTEQDRTWQTNREKILFDNGKTWEKYVDSKRIEITCGEAPYIVSRYDVTTGEKIPIEDRIGMLDRKLRVINENTETDEEWLKWVRRAFESCYGYEWQGDNLLVARCNLVMTFTEYYEARFGKAPDIKLLRNIVNIICWNFWQMDGLTGTIPYAIPQKDQNGPEQLSFEALLGETEPDEEFEQLEIAPICQVMDWRNLKKSVSYDSIRGGNGK